MKIHEYQAKMILKEYGIPVQGQVLVTDADGAVNAANQFGGTVVLKAQVLSGGRGKAGGVKLASTPEEVREKAAEIMGITVQGMPVEKLIVVPAAEIEQELYLAFTVDRNTKKITLIMSAQGGVEIEQLAQSDADAITYLQINPLIGLEDAQLKQITQRLNLGEQLSADMNKIINRLYRLCIEKDCTLLEINPFAVVQSDGKERRMLALDAKMVFDDNALYKDDEIAALRNDEEYHPNEIIAKEHGLSFVSMDGSIGCIVNGAGLAMATMDLIKYFGGEPANFLDVGGSSNPEKVLHALKIITSNPRVKAILINIFGGITRCDDIAKGLLMATEQLTLKVPLVIRLVGTNEKIGQKMLVDNGFTVVTGLNQAVKEVVAK